MALGLQKRITELARGSGPPARLMSLDAYRGFIMLAMASSAFGFSTMANSPDVLDQFSGTAWDGTWRGVWRWLAYEFEHVPWTGCGFWDLIQPSFMFMVGVAVPFSTARRAQIGQSSARQFAHVLLRSLILVVLGVFLSSQGRAVTNFTFVNVLTQIGLGYWVLHLFRVRPKWNWSPRSWLVLQGLAVAVVLIGYWGWFQSYSIPEEERETVERFVAQQMQSRGKSDAEVERELGLTRDFTGYAAHWNKHTNAAAAVDRWFLNRFPRQEPEWEGARFWVNEGGYQTLNFVPSLATMLLGLMAGTVLRAGWLMTDALRWMLLAGAVCFLVAMALDTSTWPIPFATWSICPSVKRIWSPTWAVFSSGWTFWILAAFYWIVDIRGCRRIAWPFAVVGMNSIAMYCMSQLMGGWTRETLKTHSATIDSWLGMDQGLGYLLTQSAYAPFNSRVAVLFVFWLICLWMYRRSIFIRI